MRRLTVVLAASALALAALGPAQSQPDANCTAAQKRAAQARLAAHRKAAPKQRAAYFKRHKSAKQRRAFVAKQQAKLKKLRAAANCRIQPPPPPPPPPPSPPPPDTTPPRLTTAEVNGTTLTLRLDEDLTGQVPPAQSFSVSADGLRWRVESVAVELRNVVLRLGIGVLSDEAVDVTYSPPANGLKDLAGNAIAAFTAHPTNSTPAGPAPAQEPGYSPSLPKPYFADDRVNSPQPWVGEWGPKTDPYWLHSTGTLHGLIIPVDFSDAPATRTVPFYRDYLVPPSQRYFAENSYGRLALDIQTVDRWVRMPKPAAAYTSTWGSFDRLVDFLRDATALVDSEVNFATIDAVYVVAPESVAGTLSLSLVRAWPGDGVIRDGRELRWAVVGGGGLDPRGPTANLAAHHIITHETGHFLGLPDLYDQARRGTPDQFAWAGRWDLMSDNRASSHLFTWHKWLLGWLDSRQMRGLTAGSTEAELTPLERKGGLKAIVVPISPSVVYVIEDRQRIGEDIELCDDGVLVWVVDGSRWNVDHNAVIQAAKRSYNDDCGAIADAAYDLGPGEISSFEDANVRMDVLAALPNGDYRVRVTRK